MHRTTAGGPVGAITYLDYFPEPFLDDLVAGLCLPFVGAGFSLNARLPVGKKMLDWDGVGKAIAAALQDYQYTTALDALSTYEHEFSRSKLVEFLVKALCASTAQPGAAHEGFAAMPFVRVVSTNWDFLLESAYATASKYCTPILFEEQLSISNIEPWVKLLKIHGDLNHPSRMVVTEQDYDRFLQDYPLIATYVSSMLIDSTALFIGYSLEDTDFRQIWRVVQDRLGSLRRPAYSLQVGAPARLVARYERRGVKVINLPATDVGYDATLSAAFRELRDYWIDNLPLTSTSADPEPQTDLMLPVDAQGRLAFFSVPITSAGFYKRHAYPIAEEHGFSPVMAVDVVAPGDNILAKVQALFDRSALIVLDLSTRNTFFEAGLAMYDPRIRKRMILVSADEAVPFDLRDLRIIVRPPLDDDDMAIARFINTLRASFAAAFDEISATLNDEPSRLLSKGEYRAAVLTAFSNLEHELRLASNADVVDQRFRTRPPAVRSMLREREDTLGPTLSARLGQALDRRNQVAHTNRRVAEAEATAIVDDVIEAISLLRRPSNTS